MKRLFLLLLAFTMLAFAACAAPTGSGKADVTPPSGAKWQDVPVTSTFGWGADLDGMKAVQFDRQTGFSIMVPPVHGYYSLVPKADGTTDLVHGEKVLHTYPVGTKTFEMEFEGKDRKIVAQRNPANDKRWQVYKP